MFSRAKAFLSRHKRKFLVGGAVGKYSQFPHLQFSQKHRDRKVELWSFVYLLSLRILLQWWSVVWPTDISRKSSKIIRRSKFVTFSRRLGDCSISRRLRRHIRRRYLACCLDSARVSSTVSTRRRF